ncbi:MAG TPA: acyl-CoA dehydrogenase family protein [Candidatus Bathyarchaeia archaeon]|nr:acyl-CoA dehydrogenase family protein [Candidatus Bathyarchaeia archaeon]
MDFAFTPAEERFRAELRAWLADNPPPEVVVPTVNGRSSEHPAAEAMLAWARQLARGRWLGLNWPAEYGGRGLGVIEQLIFYDEIAPFEPPQLGQMVSLGVIGPTLLRFGSAEQKRRFLPSILAAEDVWCLGFSEPGSGSDLASLRTVALPEGDGFRVNGQKIWTSHAMLAGWCLLLARSDPRAAKHHGLSVLLLDLSTPGVEVRPIHNLVGEPHFAQLFLNDVMVPRECLVGAPGQGWTIVNGALEAERDLWVFEMYGELRVAMQRAIAYARRVAGGESPGQWDASRRDRLMQSFIELEILRLSGLRSVTAALRGHPSPLDASRHKIFGSELGQRLSSLAVELEGPFALCVHGEQRSPDRGLASYQYLTRRSSTLISGTSEVQRNILAQRALGLPRG